MFPSYSQRDSFLDMSCTHTDVSSMHSLWLSLTTQQSITLQYLACWQGREGGSWQAWTSVDRSAAPPWKAPLNALKERQKKSAGCHSLGRLWMKTQRCLLGARTRIKTFSFGVWLYIYHGISFDWLCRLSGTSVKVTRAGALIVWLWYFSWIAEHIMNVKPFNCSFVGHTAKKGWIYSYLPRRLASPLHEYKSWMTFNEPYYKTWIVCHASSGQSSFFIGLWGAKPRRHFQNEVLICLLPGSCGCMFSAMYSERLRGISPLMSTSTLVCEEEIW